MSSPSDGVVMVSAFGGPRTLDANASVAFRFDLLVTPAQPFSPARHFSQRYAQVGADLPLDTAGIQKMVKREVEQGITCVNIHQAADVCAHSYSIWLRARPI